MRAVVCTNLKNSKNIWVIECCCGFRLLLKAGKLLGIAGMNGRQNFYRHVALQVGIARAVDLSHPSRTNERNHFIRAEFCASLEGHGCTGLYTAEETSRYFQYSNRASPDG